jgi:hypothetical protein
MKRALGPVLLLALGAGAWLALAPRGPAAPLGPRAVHLGEEECGECRMIVSEARFASERVLSSETTKVYDDPGCLLKELRKDRTGVLFFTDAGTGEWIPASRVRFETTSGPTPMGYGLVAFDADHAHTGAMTLEGAIAFLGSSSSKD